MSAPILFENPQVPLAGLPSAAEVSWARLRPAYLWADLIGLWLGRLLVLGVFWGYTYFTPNFPAELRQGIAGLWIFLLLASTVVRCLGFRIKGYAVRRHDLMYRSGLLFRRVTVVPFNRIQHSEIQQGLIERQFGLSQLSVFTAGGSQSDLAIPGLAWDEAERIRNFLSQKAADEEA
jgi:uncharacterized protein